MSLSAWVESAIDLPNIEKIVPIVMLKFQGKHFKTKEIDKVTMQFLNWEDKPFKWTTDTQPLPTEIIEISVYDRSTFFKDKLIGSAQISFGEILLKEGQRSVFIRKLTTETSKRIDASVTVHTQYTGPTGDVRSTTVDVQSRKVTKKKSVIITDENIPQVVEGLAETENNLELNEVNVMKVSPKLHKILPNKSIDFQVRVHIIEGRQLQGGNINPMVKVICGDKNQLSTSQKGTINPFFDELFFFHFVERPQKLFDMILDIRVLNSKIGRMYSHIIGSFRLDLGRVYDQPDQSFINKWLLLTDPDDITSGVKGYLKVSLSVITAGSSPILYPTSLADHEDDDIESNLLQPLGAELQSATLQVRLYKALDLPQMDPDYFENFKRIFHPKAKKKDNADPYCTVKFCGHKRKTHIIKNSQSPVWDKQVNIGIKFPSMSERIRLRVKDYDATSAHDTIGTLFIRMSDISSPSNDNSGYLPTFGPCYMNIYGSPREFSVLPDKYDHINKGLFEGVAYRGRIMVEVNLFSQTLPSQQIEDIKRYDIRQLQPFLTQCTYRLFGVFYSATMIHPHHSNVEFEVSIGNYGNKLEVNTPRQLSTTPISTPVFDGNNYYFLPWEKYKPCILIDSSWENVTSRIEAQNILLYITKDLGKKLHHIKNELFICTNEDKDMIMANFIDGLKEIINTIRSPRDWLPSVKKKINEEDIQSYRDEADDEDQSFNDLDRAKYVKRVEIIESLVASADELLSNKKVSFDHIIDLAETIHSQLKTLSTEPQNSIPDVFIWMLIDDKRLAYCRIPSNELMYSVRPDIFQTDPMLPNRYSGRKCGKILNLRLKPPATNDIIVKDIVPAGGMLRAMLWLGLKNDWDESHVYHGTEMYGEVYQYQEKGALGWGSEKWSDAKGKVKLDKQKDFELPFGLEWEWSDWSTIRELSTTCSPDEGLSRWDEEIFQYQGRWPFTHWPPETKCKWKDTNNDPIEDSDNKTSIKEFESNVKIPTGWEWDPYRAWRLDLHTVCDQDGWQYSTDTGTGNWSPQCLNIHTTRRRRWFRTRIKTSNGQSSETTQEIQQDDEWEYAYLTSTTYHHVACRPTHYARRKLHFKKIRILSAPLPFYFSKDLQELLQPQEGQVVDVAYKNQQVPRMFLPLKIACNFHCRVYIFQGRDLFAADNTGFSDPFCIVSFGNYSETSRIIYQNLNPKWKQTLVFENVKIFGDENEIRTSLPPVVIELFDQDRVGKDYMGTTQFFPVLHTKTIYHGRSKLTWHQVKRYESNAGDVLIASEVFMHHEDVFIPDDLEKKEKNGIVYFDIPREICPVYEKMRIEILCWGVRDLKKYHFTSVKSPFVKIECEDKVETTESITDARKDPNFRGTVIIMSVKLPTERQYMPPFNIHVFDKRRYGQRPLIGTHVIRSIEQFIIQEEDRGLEEQVYERGQPIIEVEKSYSDEGHEQTAIKIEETVTTSVSSKTIGTTSTTTTTITSTKPTKPKTEMGMFEWLTNKFPTTGEVTKEHEDFILNVDPDSRKSTRFDWWTKYYATLKKKETKKKKIEQQEAAKKEGKQIDITKERKKRRITNLDIYLQKGYDCLKIYEDELENYFNNFYDYIRTFNLYRGKGTQMQDKDYMGKLKGIIKVYKPTPSDSETEPKHIKISRPKIHEDVIIRVYVIKGNQLRPLDVNGKSDPYLVVSIGDQKLGNSEDCVKNNVNPIFGRMFQLIATLPLEHTLKIEVYDYDYGSRDDLIGFTEIDIENRYYSNCRATCGIPQTFSIAGPNSWRDAKNKLPSDILDEYCINNNLDKPSWSVVREVDTVEFKRDTYTLSHPSLKVKQHDFLGSKKEQLALCLLRKEKVLVPEHIETRTLYNPSQPNIPQGNLHMWVDIFPNSKEYLPEPVDISPREPEDYVLRVVIYSVVDVELKDYNPLTEERMSDIYIKGWLKGQEDIQKTDIHYRSYTGEGNFNWRFVFPFKFLPTEEKLVVFKKEHFYSRDETELHFHPCLMLQAWDNDTFRFNDFLGVVELDLTNIPRPARTSSDGSFDAVELDINGEVATDNLFDKKRVKGWWKLTEFDRACDLDDKQGKIQLEIELVSLEEHELMPVGKGQEEPNRNPHLPKPFREETSFNWLTSPAKACEYIIWKVYKWQILFALFIVMLILMCAVWIYSIPQYLSRYILDRVLP